MAKAAFLVHPCHPGSRFPALSTWLRERRPPEFRAFAPEPEPRCTDPLGSADSEARWLSGTFVLPMTDDSVAQAPERLVIRRIDRAIGAAADRGVVALGASGVGGFTLPALRQVALQRGMRLSLGAALELALLPEAVCGAADARGMCLAQHEALVLGGESPVAMQVARAMARITRAVYLAGGSIGALRRMADVLSDELGCPSMAVGPEAGLIAGVAGRVGIVALCGSPSRLVSVRLRDRRGTAWDMGNLSVSVPRAPGSTAFEVFGVAEAETAIATEEGSADTLGDPVTITAEEVHWAGQAARRLGIRLLRVN